MRLLAGVVTLALSGVASAAGCTGTGAPPAWAGPGVYRGTLGGQPVALELRKEDGQLVGAYFYERKGTDLPLTLKHRGDALLAQEEVWGGPANGTRVTGCLNLKANGTGLEGQWISSDGKRTLPVHLALLDVTRLLLKLPDSPGLRKMRASTPLAFLKLNRPWQTVAGGKNVVEPFSGVTYPRIPGGSAALNAALQDRHLKHAADALDCRARLGDLRDEGYTLKAQVTFQGARLLSVFENVAYFCGGAHPDAFDQGVILDRTTGRSVQVETLWPGLTPARLKQAYVGRTVTTDGECRQVLAEMSPEFTAHLTPAGLAVTPNGLPHVVFACAETVTLPFARLRTYADPRGPYFRELYPQ
ncbi:hypothetical protein [Deinococcus hopiensis]|uniref:DUF3298 domain-containing protein n=1 Tax=Deinococcus hopiensis KR-140 TaxID=695939 RepID=A0A1W1VPX2_9DEIO|nr:hypothetical protein [Deinococcus hopiensis]SMB95386.1 hypothetical protein SAMN00790413_02809 [Deinococcus hopiensis KR-140]